MSQEPSNAQKEIINHKDGHLLTIAGPGSGKTFVIVERVKKLIESGVGEDEILCVTFTEKATTELRQRLRSKLRELLEWIDETARRDEISPYQIIGRDDIQSVLKDCEPSKRFDRVQAILLPLRYPSLSALRKEIWLALDHLKLDFKTKIRIDENFEKDDIRIELNFQTLKELQTQIEKLSQAARSQAINELIEIFQKLGNKS